MDEATRQATLDLWNSFTARERGSVMLTVGDDAQLAREVTRVLNARASSCPHPGQLAGALGSPADTAWGTLTPLVTMLVTRDAPPAGATIDEIPPAPGISCNHARVIAGILNRPPDRQWALLLEEVRRMMARQPTMAPAGAPIAGGALRIEAVKPWEPKDFPEFKDRKDYWSWRCIVRRRLRWRVPAVDEIPTVLEVLVSNFKGKLTSFAESADVTQYIKPSTAAPNWTETQTAFFQAADKFFLPQEFYQQSLDEWHRVKRATITGEAEELMIDFQEKLWVVQEAARHRSIDGPGRATRVGTFRSALPKQMVAWLNMYHYGWDLQDWDTHRESIITAWNNIKAANGYIPSGRMAARHDEDSETEYGDTPAPATRMGKRKAVEDDYEDVSMRPAKRRPLPPPAGQRKCRVMKKFDEAPRVPSDCQGPLTRRQGMSPRDEQEARLVRERCRKQKRCIRCRRFEDEHTGDFVLTTPWPANVRVATLSSADVGLESDVEDELDD